MFIIERFINEFQLKQETYERRAEKWVAAGESGGYNYRSEREYARQYGKSPVDKLRTVAEKIPIILFAIAISFCMVKFVTVSVEKESQTNKTSQEAKE